MEPAPGSKPFSLAHDVRSEEEVDELFALLENRGVEIVKRPEKTFFGAYGGYVADVEGNLWDIAYNPYVEHDERVDAVAHGDIEHLEQ